MSDLELMRLAAEAAGYEFVRYSECGDGVLLAGIQDAWRPLTDDGDALRLAVQIGPLEFSISEYGAAVRKLKGQWVGCEAHLHGGKQAATRRAIVRAAASIATQAGKGME